MKTVFACLLACLVLVGCASSYQVNEVQPAEHQFDPAAGVLVAVPKDGRYGNKQYPGSGLMTADAVRTAFARHAVRSDIAEDCAGEACRTGIDPATYGYFVQPEILHWEDRATEWSGKPDRIEIRLSVFDTHSGEELARSTYSGSSKWATFGGDHPQDLLAEPTGKHVDSLYR